MSRRLQQGNCTICKILKFLPCQKKQVYNIHQKFYIRLIGCSVYLPSLDPDFVPARELLGPGPWERCWFPFGGSWWTPWCTDSLRFSWFPWHSGEAFWRPASPFPTKKTELFIYICTTYIISMYSTHIQMGGTWLSVLYHTQFFNDYKFNLVSLLCSKFSYSKILWTLELTLLYL